MKKQRCENCTRPVTVLEYGRMESGTQALQVKCEGMFHGFGVDYEEFENGTGNFSTAIVELKSGEVINIPAYMIRFNDATGESDEGPNGT